VMTGNIVSSIRAKPGGMSVIGLVTGGDSGKTVTNH